MELKRILANDLRSATEKAIRIYGPNTLVVSSERVNGGVEVIVATDFSQNPDLANPTVNSVASEKEPKAVSRSFSDELAHDSFDEILYESIGKKRSLNSKQEKTLQDPVSTQNIERDGSDQLKKTLVRNAGPKVDKEPTLSHKTFHDTKIRAQKKKLEEIGRWEMEEPQQNADRTYLTPSEEEKSLNSEELRAREIVDLVLSEMAEVKKELQFAKKTIHMDKNGFTDEISDFVEIVKMENLPLSLQTLLLEDVSGFSSKEDAFEKIRDQLIESTRGVETLNSSELRGANIFIGPSGAGKTTVIMKIIHSLLHENLASDNIAILSFKQNTVGSWTQLQLFGSSLGIDVFKVKNQEMLRTLVTELSDKKLVFIDTSGAKIKEELDDILKVIPSSQVHVVMPIDASVALARKWCDKDGINWNSMFLSKYDEAISPWGLLQALLNSKLKISSLVSSGPTIQDYKEFKVEDLVNKCTEKINEKITSDISYIDAVESHSDTFNRKNEGL